MHRSTASDRRGHNPETSLSAPLHHRLDEFVDLSHNHEDKIGMLARDLRHRIDEKHPRRRMDTHQTDHLGAFEAELSPNTIWVRLAKAFDIRSVR
jgi:hypothetical protein